MKRWLFISGIILILILTAVWMFLLFASNETKQDIYNSFGLTGEEEGILGTIIDVALPELPAAEVPLRQLTTRRVIGYTEVALASSSPAVLFVEAGTGHVYKLNLQDGSETRISNITIPGANEAVVSRSGAYAAIKSGNQEAGGLTLIHLTETPTTEELPEAALQFTITTTDMLLYTTVGASGVVARSFDFESRAATTLFSTPFRMARVLFGDGASDTHYIYPKTARSLEGSLYATTQGVLTHTGVTGYGLTALVGASYTLYTTVTNERYASFITTEGVATRTAVGFYPEKCTSAAASSVLYCASGTEFSDTNFPDNWYRGEVSYTDNLWRLNAKTGQVNFLIDTLDSTGRQLDIVLPLVSSDEMDLYFKNKNDHTLWVYDLTYTSVTE